MDEQARSALREQLDELAAAEEKLYAARKPFDDAIFAIDNVRESLLERHDADLCGRCEGCADIILKGDKAHIGEDVSLCEACAPTYRECKTSWEEAMARDDCDEADAKEVFAAFERHVANGGSLDDKNVYTV
jgi:hypothetical protein